MKGIFIKLCSIEIVNILMGIVFLYFGVGLDFMGFSDFFVFKFLLVGVMGNIIIIGFVLYYID